MRDVGIITPTRFRPENARRLIDAVAGTAVLATDVILAVDEDDGSYPDLESAPGLIVVRGPRKNCIQWSNHLAAEFGGAYRYLASFGDDHEPRTHAWDAHLTRAIEQMGGTGIAYGNDTLQGENLPTAPVISSNIAAALGWLMYPGLGHFFADNVWKDLAAGQCLAYLPQVIIKHYHYSFGTARMDDIYAEAAPAWAADEPAYRAWRAADDGMARDREKIGALCQHG